MAVNLIAAAKGIAAGTTEARPAALAWPDRPTRSAHERPAAIVIERAGGGYAMVTTVMFAGGEVGPWIVTRADALRGEALRPATRVSVAEVAPDAAEIEAAWRLCGFVSNLRYATRRESDLLQRVQPALGRPAATRAALIPIRKSAAWWELAQDERRAIFEETSHHTKIGIAHLPAVARRLHHCRDLDEPFDFLTWFEFAPEDEGSFDELVSRLRSTREWGFVEREIDIRLSLADARSA